MQCSQVTGMVKRLVGIPRACPPWPSKWWMSGWCALGIYARFGEMASHRQHWHIQWLTLFLWVSTGFFFFFHFQLRFCHYVEQCTSLSQRLSCIICCLVNLWRLIIMTLVGHTRLCWGLGVTLSCTVVWSFLFLWQQLLSLWCHGCSLVQLIWIWRSCHDLGIYGLLHQCWNRTGCWSVLLLCTVWRWIVLDLMLYGHSMLLTLVPSFVYFQFHSV